MHLSVRLPFNGTDGLVLFFNPDHGMSPKKPTKTLSTEDITLFRNAIQKIEPIKQDKLLLNRKMHDRIKSLITSQKEEPKGYLSDHFLGETVTSEQKLFFAKINLSPKHIKKLKQCKINPLATLDLHGFNSKDAAKKLIAFIDAAYQQNQRYVCIIHGKGDPDKPILKNKVNQWLRQLDNVLAFCTTQPRYGGTGAVYVLLRAKNGIASP